ncbi:hypothetical protein ACQW02_20645 [Humitalea sp. 24SJ18S-53]|uniref:hypothetical protein n=1 Tax=Humitalea sp. 24SJ18S-53 TaxID=3422307 RepID=UPI003D67D3BE
MRPVRGALPSVGDVIRYAYLWSHEHDAGREEAVKDRPAAVVALIRTAEGANEVVVLPITSSAPTESAAGVEIPAPTRARLGLQREQCWIMVSEFNVFGWPGPDLRATEAGAGSVVYGPLPSVLMARVRQAFAAWRNAKHVRAVRRTE